MADDVSYPWMLINRFYTPTTGLPIYFMIQASSDRLVDCIKFHMTGTAMTSFHAAVFTVSSENTLTRVMNLGNVKSLLTGTRTLQVIPLPEPMAVSAGDVFMVGLLSVGGTQPQIHSSNFIGQVNLTTGDVPAYNQIAAPGATGSQTSFSTTMTMSASPGGNTRIWGALGNAAVPLRPPSFFVDTFNRINMPELTLPWAARVGNPGFGVYNNTASPNVGAGMPFQYWVPNSRSDDHYVQLKLGMDASTEANRDIDLYAGVRSGNNGVGKTVLLHLNGSGARDFRIVTVDQPYDLTGLVSRAVAASVPEFQNGDVVKLVSDSTIYTALFNDVPLTSWVDTGAVQPIGADHHGVTLATSTVAEPNLQIIDNFEFGDFGGGVQLVAAAGIPSGEAFGTSTVRNDLTVAPGKAALVLGGKVPTLRTGVAIRPPKGSLILTGATPTLDVSAHPIVFGAQSISSNNSAANSSASVPLSMTHSASGVNRIAILAVMQVTDGTNVNNAIATYGGITMTLVTNQRISLNDGSRLWIFALLNPPTGAKSVAATFASPTDYNATIAACVVSYTGVANYALAGGGNGVSSTPAQSVPSTDPRGRLVQVFGAYIGTGIGSFTKSVRSSASRTAALPASVLIGDSAGAIPAVDFSATVSQAAYWAAANVRLIPV